MSDVITNKYILQQLTVYSKLKDSPVACPRIHLEPSKGFNWQPTDVVAVRSLWTNLNR